VPIDLTNRPIAITGASSGIGRAAALACARAGMPVAVLARRTERLEELCSQIESQGGRAIAVPGSVEVREDCEALIERTVEAFGSIYGVYANAGYSHERACIDMSDDEIRRMFEVNFYGSLNVVYPALEHMRRAGAGHVVFCSSCLSKIAPPRYGCYSATKACQDHFARSMRLELRGTGVHVSSVHPIPTKTEFFEAKQAGAEVHNQPPGWLMQSPERVASAMVRCLRRPRGEVWTSTITRLLFGLGVMAPGLADWVLAQVIKTEQTPNQG